METMRRNILKIVLSVISVFSLVCCADDFPVDEDGLLITDRAQCYVSDFDLFDTSHQTVRVKSALIDTTLCTVDVTVRYGTDLKHLWPRFSLCEDAKLDPKITGFTDFSDLDNPRKYTVISGNRKIRKTYSINITVQQPK